MSITLAPYPQSCSKQAGVWLWTKETEISTDQVTRKYYTLTLTVEKCATSFDRKLEEQYMKHSFNESDYVPDGKISLDTELLKPLVSFSLHAAAHDQNHLCVKLEVRLPAHVAARRALKHEAKVCHIIISAP